MATVFPQPWTHAAASPPRCAGAACFRSRSTTSRHDSAGRFVWDGVAPREKGGQIALGQPWLNFGVSDLRGLQGQPELKLAGQTLTISAAPADADLPLPLAAALGADLLQPGAALDFTLGMDLAGTGQIGFVPLADDNKLSLVSGLAAPHLRRRLPAAPAHGERRRLRGAMERARALHPGAAAVPVAGQGARGAGQLLGLAGQPGRRLPPDRARHQVRPDVHRAHLRRLLRAGDGQALAHPPHAVPDDRRGPGAVLLLLLSLSEQLGFFVAYLAASAAASRC